MRFCYIVLIILNYWNLGFLIPARTDPVDPDAITIVILYLATNAG